MMTTNEALKDFTGLLRTGRGKSLAESFEKERGFTSAPGVSYKHKDGTIIVANNCNVPRAKGGSGLDIAIIKGDQYLRISSYNEDKKCVISMNEFGSDKKQEMSLPMDGNAESVKNVSKVLPSDIKGVFDKYVPVELIDIVMEFNHQLRLEKRNSAFKSAFNKFINGGATLD